MQKKRAGSSEKLHDPSIEMWVQINNKSAVPKYLDAHHFNRVDCEIAMHPLNRTQHSYAPPTGMCKKHDYLVKLKSWGEML